MNEFVLLTAPLGQIAGIALLGAITGVASMLLYARLSPQSRIAELSTHASDARMALNRFDGDDLGQVLTLTRSAVRLSLRQVGLVLVPTILAGAFAVGSAWLVNANVHLSQLHSGPPWAPAWLRAEDVAFWIPLSVTAMGTKWILKIK